MPLLFAPAFLRQRRFPWVWDATAALLVFGLFAAFGLGLLGALAPIEKITTEPISLNPVHLPEYAVRSVLRMAAAMLASLFFTFTYGVLAAKSRRAEPILIPLLDVLQSVPILGYLSFTVVFFMSLFPRRVLGAELAAVFAVFTSQAWNMAFSFYQALRTVPQDLQEAASAFRFPAWQRFWRLEVPFAIPGLVWNMMMSASGGWFFVVASEAISVGERQIALPGIGSYVALAIARQDLHAIGWAIIAMTLAILVYDQILFRPLVVWADRFRFEQTARDTSHSWFLYVLRRSWFIQRLGVAISFALRRLLRARLLNFREAHEHRPIGGVWPRLLDLLWYGAVLGLVIWASFTVVRFMAAELFWSDVVTAIRLGFYTLLRVIALVALAAMVWVPIGVIIGLRPRLAEHIQPLAQFLAAFPANLLFPIAVFLIVRWHLNPEIWLSLLMILGTQWYILFNVIAGTVAYPTDLLEAAAMFRFRGWQWWRQALLPGIFPYFVTGAITASGGAWNASVVAENVSWGEKSLSAHGLGAYIAVNTTAGDYPKIVLGIVVMSLFVILLNRLVWRPLYAYGERHFKLE
jgi:NitT/TauT family transport system permease protein